MFLHYSDIIVTLSTSILSKFHQQINFINSRNTSNLTETFQIFFGEIIENRYESFFSSGKWKSGYFTSVIPEENFSTLMACFSIGIERKLFRWVTVNSTKWLYCNTCVQNLACNGKKLLEQRIKRSDNCSRMIRGWA